MQAMMQTGTLSMKQQHNDSSVMEDDMDMYDQACSNDLGKLKDISEKLKLATRRPSVLQWKQVIENRRSMGFYTSGDSTITELDAAVENATLGDIESTEKFIKKPKLCITLSADILPQQPEIDLNNNTLSYPTDKLNENCANISNNISKTAATLQPQSNITDNHTDFISNDDNDDVNGQNDVEKNRKVIKEFCNKSLDVEHVESPCISSSNLRCRYIGKALAQLRKDLITMRIEDHKLARDFLNIRSNQNELKAHRSCDEHADMLDDFTYEMEEEEDVPGLVKACDLQLGLPGSLLSAFSPLRNIGLSRMNLNTRRFSIR